MRLQVGTSGWMYDHWRGEFYPAELPKSKWLSYYVQHFSTVELNSSFYHLPSEKAFGTWRDKAPDGFVYAVKVSRYITHLKKLRDVEEPLETFVSRARLLGDKLGPLLYQLPPGLKRNVAVLEDFLKLLPGDLQHVFEFRNESWFDDEVYALLRKYRAGFCVYDLPGTTTPLVATADFAYVRFHGSVGLYDSCYTDDELRSWAKKIARLGKGLSVVYVYFNNDSHAFAIRNARDLRRLLALH
jgi:uncharacterized protein YecE (DUF72 family)